MITVYTRLTQYAGSRIFILILHLLLKNFIKKSVLQAIKIFAKSPNRQLCTNKYYSLYVRDPESGVIKIVTPAFLLDFWIFAVLNSKNKG